MVFENLANPGTTDVLLVLVVFLILIMVVKKIMNIVTNVVIISVAAVLLPIIANRFLGLNVPTDLNSLLNFVIVGVVAYFAYTGLKYAYALAKGASKVGKKMVPKGGKKEKVRVVEKEVMVEKHGNAPRVADKKKHRSEKEVFKDYVMVKDTEVSVKKDGDYAEIEEKPKKTHAEPLPEIKHKKKREE